MRAALHPRGAKLRYEAVVRGCGGAAEAKVEECGRQRTANNASRG